MVNDGDTTARAKIRDCALRLFGEHGPDAVTVRDIAACARVSPGLVLHHFGSKQGLREAVDAHVMSIFDAMLASAAEDPDAFASGEPQAVAGFAEMFASQIPADSPIPGYLRRLLLSGDPVGRHLFRQWFQLTLSATDIMSANGNLQPTPDRDALAAFLLVNDLAMILLHDHVADAIGTDPLSPAGMRRWASIAFDVYLHGAFTKEDS
ncbi:TetR/AcrR family transcriptional regulator [Demequina lutea]|uniref:AcrR family transcriptional regulator n=1 Tax=Demequina lutea TaxID=431489 RepID=A0A7Y9Z8C8_9MICO|nr:TetR/AcrR family transcriptional regulator [Demequina lutea]NYI40115.1 AcrR family transcriptional regulator [Demequina lutea]